MQIPSPLLLKFFQLLPENKKWQIFVKKQKSSGRYLEVGDHVECSIATDDGAVNLGTMSNRIQAPRGES